MARSRPSTEPHLFVTDNGIDCTFCNLPQGNARHTGAACSQCGCLMTDHGRHKRKRWCTNCHTECPL